MSEPESKAILKLTSLEFKRRHGRKLHVIKIANRENDCTAADEMFIMIQRDTREITKKLFGVQKINKQFMEKT